MTWAKSWQTPLRIASTSSMVSVDLGGVWLELEVGVHASTELDDTIGQRHVGAERGLGIVGSCGERVTRAESSENSITSRSSGSVESAVYDVHGEPALGRRTWSDDPTCRSGSSS